MARTEARISVEIWDDEHFLALSPQAQRLFMFLLSQRELTHVGVLPLRERRWASKANGLDFEEVYAQLDELARHRFIAVDDEEGEVLIRSFMRRDKVYKQPQVMRAAADQLAMVNSRHLRSVIAAELERIAQIEGLHEASAETVATMRAAIKEPASTLLSGSDEPDHPRQEEGGMVTTVGTDSPSLDPQTSDPEAPPPPPAAKAAEPREDVEQICDRLAKWIIHNGSRKPTIGERWRTEARLLIDRDKRPVDEIKRIIDWCQKDSFWKGNILSMPKFREKYDRLRLASNNEQSPQNGGLNGYRRPGPHQPFQNPADISAYHGDL